MSNNNWDTLHNQPCGGLEQCNCFLGNEFFGYDINTMDSNDTNWNNLCEWMTEQGAPEQLTVAQLKAWCVLFKDAGLLTR